MYSKNLVLIFFFTAVTSVFVFGQKDTTYWKKGGTANINFSQVSLTNWAAGGLNSISLNGFINAFANYEKDDITWENTIDLGYGIIKQGETPFRKSDDRLELNSKLGKKITDKFSYSALANYRSQFAPGFDLPNDSNIISDFMSPGFALASIGIDYKPNKKLSFFVSPVTGKFTFVSNQILANAGAFGVTAAERNDLGQIITLGRRFRAELGGLVRFAYRQDVVENVTLQLKGDFFSNYLNNPQNIDVNIETIIDFKINKFLSANFLAHLVYDDDIKVGVDTNGDGQVDKNAVRTQLRQIFGVGLAFKF